MIPDGDCLAAKLRAGNVHSADGWEEVLLPVIDRYRAQGQTVGVRADAAFALPASSSGCSRRCAASFGTPGTSSSSLPKVT
ncbi:MAG: hypothetical protein DMF83_29205 [Acidobacteria bacterium]|nr:MAG: hypothetical protein DMF83_29205 [Acidobacteriota bacterium]